METDRPKATHILKLRITENEREILRKEADETGYEVASLLRLRIFGKVKGMRVTRRPSTDVMLLGDIIGKLTALTAELNKLGSNINQIAKRLNQGSRDVFGVDGALRLFHELGQRLFKTLNLIEAAITGCLSANNHNEEE